MTGLYTTPPIINVSEHAHNDSSRAMTEHFIVRPIVSFIVQNGWTGTDHQATDYVLEQLDNVEPEAYAAVLLGYWTRGEYTDLIDGECDTPLHKSETQQNIPAIAREILTRIIFHRVGTVNKVIKGEL